MQVTAQTKSALRGLALWAAVGAAWAAYWLATAAERERDHQINPAIYQAFRAIESECISEDWPRRTVRCQQALDHSRSCQNAARSCGAIDHYGTLVEAGFDLPPLFAVRE